ncbi:MAG TPA: MBL fold metallo-hydrolase [Vicinamibacterales bacterium]|nr:MBL fold metallo-hydrolase [Vicinamibacterales bacterium]
MTLTFLGAARTVTGSKYLLEVDGHRVLIDCGLFQGAKVLRERNWQSLPVRADSIHAIVLTHAHLDHCGYLPRLVSQGFKGRIFCTPATSELSKIVLADAAKLQEEDAERANRKGYTKHHPALPLFTEEDAARAMTMLQPLGYDRPIDVAPGVTVDFINAGHLLGSAYARLRIASTGKTLLFGGDLGRYGRPVLPDPQPVDQADVVLVESTYGDRIHEQDDNGSRLAEIVTTTAERRGKVIIPAFALGRVEELLYWLNRLEDERRIPELPVYVDSPMASAVLAEYRKRIDELDPEIATSAEPNGYRRAAERKLCAFCTAKLKVIASIAESRAVQESNQPAVVISSSGMATGGRVLHHLSRALPFDRNTVLFSGFQAQGTRGRAIKDGAAYTRIHGQEVPVRARVEALDSMSAHADASEILRWLKGFRTPPSLVCLVHGETGPMDVLKGRIEREFGWKVLTPAHQEKIDLPVTIGHDG